MKANLDRRGTAREEGAARGAAVHALLEWSQANGWREPSAELARRHAVAEGLDPGSDGLPESLLAPVRGWLGSSLLRERVGTRRRASAPRRRSCSASPARSCAARSTCWSSARGRRRSSSTTRPTASTAPARPSTPPATRSSATSTPSPWPSRAARPRWRSPTSSSSARRSRRLPARPGRDGGGAGATRRRHRPDRRGRVSGRPAAARSWSLCDGVPGAQAAVLGPCSSFAASSSSLSSLRPSPTASSSAAQ